MINVLLHDFIFFFISSPRLPMEQVKVQIDQMVNQLKQRSFSESSSVDLKQIGGTK